MAILRAMWADCRCRFAQELVQPLNASFTPDAETRTREFCPIQGSRKGRRDPPEISMPGRWLISVFYTTRLTSWMIFFFSSRFDNNRNLCMKLFHRKNNVMRHPWNFLFSVFSLSFYSTSAATRKFAYYSLIVKIDHFVVGGSDLLVCRFFFFHQ